MRTRTTKGRKRSSAALLARLRSVISQRLVSFESLPEQSSHHETALESERQADDIRARLEDSDNFTELAGEFSLDTYSKEQNGDLGLHPQGISPALLGTSIPDDYAFSPQTFAHIL